MNWNQPQPIDPTDDIRRALGASWGKPQPFVVSRQWVKAMRASTFIWEELPIHIRLRIRAECDVILREGHGELAGT